MADKITSENDPSQVSVPYTPPLAPTDTSATTAAPVTGPSTISSIGTSESVASTPVPEASTPTIPPPGTSNAANKAHEVDAWVATNTQQSSSNYQDWQHSAISGMLDAWLESLQKAGEEMRRQWNDPAFQAFLLQQTSAFQARVHELSVQSPSSAPSESLRAGFINSMDNYLDRVHQKDSDAVSVLPFIAATAVLTVTSVGPAMTLQQVAQVGGVGPFAQIWENVATVVIASDMRAELGLIGALFASGLMYHTSAESVAASTGTRGGAKDIDFARNYARNLIGLINSNQLDQFVKTMVINKLENGEPLSEERKQQLANIVKIVLLSMSLAFIYRVEAGKITDQEFHGMLHGDIDIPKTDVKYALIDLILKNLDTLDRGERTRLLTGIMSYLETSPNLDSMLDPNHAFVGLLQHLNVHNEAAV